MMDKNQIINKINNKYILKIVYSYIDYHYILKLIQNNKNLQKRLGISIANYRNKSDFPTYKYTSHHPRTRCSVSDFYAYLWYFIYIPLIVFSYFIYTLIYIILLVDLDTFDDSNTIENYNKTSLKIINKINRYLFVYAGSIIGFIFACYYIYNDFYYDRGIKKVFKSSLMVLFNLINISSEGLVIWKLILSYKIKKSGVRWFIVMDFIFVFLNLFYILFIFIITFIFFKESGIEVIKMGNDYHYDYILISFNDINILPYCFTLNFENLSEKERKKLILQNYKKYQYEITDEQKNLINEINIFRDDNNIPKLKFDKENKIPEFIIEKPSEMILFPEENIFEISNKKYLFKYPIGEFEKKFKNNDEEIINILLKDNLNYIQIVTQKENEYLLIFEKIFNTSKRIELVIKDNNSDRIEINEESWELKGK